MMRSAVMSTEALLKYLSGVAVCGLKAMRIQNGTTCTREEAERILLRGRRMLTMACEGMVREVALPGQLLRAL